MSESWGSHNRLSRVKKQGVRLSGAWGAGRNSRRVLDQRRAVRESWGAMTGPVRAKGGSVRVKERGRRLSRTGEPGKTHAES